MPDVFTKAKRSEVMALIRSKGTKIEQKLIRRIKESGLRGYSMNPRMYANPDIVFTRYRVAIFCDGDFWHGKNYKKLEPKLKNKFWKEKIQANKKRDRKYNAALRKKGWVVLRFWESEINTNLEKCFAQITSALTARKLNG